MVNTQFSQILRKVVRVCSVFYPHEGYTGTDIRGILMRVASAGCFPAGVWRRGSWHVQVASLHLQLSMDLPFVRFTLFLLPEQA